MMRWMTSDAGAETFNTFNGILQVLALVVAAVIILWLDEGNGMAQLRVVIAPQQSLIAATVNPPPFTRLCLPRDLQLTGAFDGCAAPMIAAPQTCVPPLSADSYLAVIPVRDYSHDYLLYVAVDGGHLPPGTYPLFPAIHPGLGQHDGLVKVAVREAVTGALWVSSAGWLTINSTGRSGAVRQAILQREGGTSKPSDRSLQLDGPWSCE